MSKDLKYKQYILRNKINRERAPFPNPTFILAAFILLIVGYGFYQFAHYMLTESSMFLLKEVKVTGNNYIDKKAIIRSASIKMGTRIFHIPTNDLVERILKNPYLQGVSITRALPSTLIIAVQERKPVAYLVDNNVYMVDRWGKMLLKKPGMFLEDLPLITGLSVRSLLKNREPLFDALSLIRVVSDVDNSLFSFISEIHISADSPPCIYLVKGGALVELGSDKLHKRIYILSEFLKKPSIINQLDTVKKIDFNYRNRIVVTRKS